MRIVGGTWRGRTLRAPQGLDTRPTSDRVREGVFDALCARMGADLGGAAVLDAFAGTGAMGLEALSRGACRAVFVEHAREAGRVLEANISVLGAGERATVVLGDSTGAGLVRAATGGPFGLLLLDPPYRIDPAEVVRMLARLMELSALEPDAIVAYEHPTAQEPVPVTGFVPIRTYRYGETSVTLSQRAGAAGEHA